ncbi:3-hydroxyacyl-CoA dehydrogenase NAD-binding domain-containing protein [Thiolapillus sp.]
MNKHFHVQYDEQQIAWLSFDAADATTNVLTEEALEEFDQQLLGIAQSHPKGLVILSAKKNGFIAGADVKTFATIHSPEAAKKLILRAHDIFHRLEALPFPSVALIHGFCLGGGLELALACRYRIASTDPSTRLGFPEIRLGIFPGFGGSVRSIELLGHLPAMQMMLSARSLSAKAAKRIHLLDYAVPQRQLKNTASKLIEEQPPRHQANLLQRIPGSFVLRPVIAGILRKQVAKRVRQSHYPAPYALIAHWRQNAGNSAQMYASEAQQVSSLLTGETAQNLIRVFLLQDLLKGLAEKSDFLAKHVHVIGGGVMGGDIAAWCVLRGLKVTLQDRAPEYLGRAIARAHALFQKKLKDRYLLQDAVDRLLPDHLGEGVGKADVVIEAIFEDMGAKQKLYEKVEPQMKADALLATNTSSIPLEKLAEKLQHPARLIGLHFFNPVAKMPLVEIVTQADNPPQLIADATRFAKAIGKLPLPVTSRPGFLVNRVLMPYLLEAVTLLEEGVPATDIDKAAIRFGMPMGPVELADTVGLDICLSVAEKLAETLHNEVPTNLRDKVEAGHLGKKSGQGFYTWSKGKKAQKETARATTDKLDHYADRMILRLVNESMACLREAIVDDADLLDAGIVFGTGFAPFRGGPMHYADKTGTAEILSKLRKLEYTYGNRFAPDPGWEDHFTKPGGMHE